MRRSLAWFVVLALASAVTACAARGARIADVQHQPGRYYDRSVRLEGTVTESWSMPLVPFGLYKIADGTGELTVVSRSSRAPTRGARVRVTGEVGELAVFGGRSVGLHLRERRLDVLRRR
ncbi:MAG: hypothetical protein KJ066_10420 [Acidobacteria bacterium]|nr:hypothetical protein [Acidobacteriota bacterium]